MRLLWVVSWIPLSLALGCGNTTSWTPDIATLTPPGTLTNALTPLFTPTYDGSGQATEPTVIYFPYGWQGHLYWMVLSPYPDGDSSFENPSVLVSDDGHNWSVPAGLSNPLWLPSQGHLSDATLFYDDQSDQLFVYFLNEIPGPDPRYTLLRTQSSDGVHWSLPEAQLSGEKYSVSPTVAKIGSTHYLWMINSDSGCTGQTSTMIRRSSLDGVTWSPPEPMSITQPGFVMWHMNMISVPSEGQFMSLIAAYPLGSDCTHTKLFFANSSDGIAWTTYSQPILDVDGGWQSQEIYRSSLVYDLDKALLRVWYSAADAAAGKWHIGYTETPFSLD